MPKVYKIHPGIGIMRVGDHPDAFFVGPETPGRPGVELGGAGENPVQQYKVDGRLKRQAARFRVWEYDQAADGTLVPVREIAAGQATVAWKVTLVNRKAASESLMHAFSPGWTPVLLPKKKGRPRNRAVEDRESLIIRGGTRTVAGANQPAAPFDEGKFLGTPVYLGEVRTDAAGRLLVLGGRGKSAGIPTAVGKPVPPLSSVANNDRWHDDVSDGPVTATITFPGHAAIEVQHPAWVICAPPDFAPAVGGVATLYEVALQAAIARKWMTAPNPPKFRRDILPTLARAAALRWTHNWEDWKGIPETWEELAKPDAGHQELRGQVYEEIVSNTIRDFRLPPYLSTVLQSWRDGTFENDWAAGDPVLTEPQALDRAALEACAGSNFYPGIEAGYGIAREKEYSGPFRLAHTPDGAGRVTAAMALPWQADFNDCNDDWWPSQRPNYVFKTAASVSDDPVRWARGVSAEKATAAERKRMVENFSRLGFVVQDGQGNFLEAERDNTLSEI
jgi:hypothetical protein